jgi:hypothetical protein
MSYSDLDPKTQHDIDLLDKHINLGEPSTGAMRHAWLRVRSLAEKSAEVLEVDDAAAKIVAARSALFDLWYLRRDPIAEGCAPEPDWDYVFRLCIHTISHAIGDDQYGAIPALPPTADDDM